MLSLALVAEAVTDRNPRYIMDRLQKILSQWGIASRRQAETLILSGRVRLNGEIATLGIQANPAIDRIEVDGKVVCPCDRPKQVYLLLNKPLGVISTCRDSRGRRTVLDLLPPNLRSHQGIHPVGRLDADSTGALILTNDGDLTFRLTHPRHEIPKIYQVWVAGTPTPAVLEHWQQGVFLDQSPTLPAKVRILQKEPEKTLLQITIREGKNRQIRRVAAQLGYPVISLHRIAIGIIQLSHPHQLPLPSGKYRQLTTQEIKFLQKG